MSVIDILFRVDSVCKKYDKYDVEKQRDLNANGGDPLFLLYASVERDIEAALLKAEVASTEKNRASAVALNAQVRRSKARLMEEVTKLGKLARKKVKGLSKEDLEIGNDLILALLERIQAIPDGTMSSAKQTGEWASSVSNKNIKFDTSDGNLGSDFFQQTEESSQVRQKYEIRKLKQDQGLDFISEGLDALKNLAHAVNEVVVVYELKYIEIKSIYLNVARD